MNKHMMRLGAAVAAIGMLTCGFAQAQSEPLIDHETGQISSKSVELGGESKGNVKVYSAQSPTGSSANVGSEAAIYLAPNNEPLTYSVFLNLNSSTGALFPGVMFADNMGLGAGYVPGTDDISSYDALFFRSSSDPQPGLADFRMALWDGDPFCTFDTPGGGYACAPIAGTEADIVDVPGATSFTAVHVLPKGITAPNQRVWMVVSGSETGVNPSPCRLGWDIAYGPAVVGDNNITGNPAADDFFMTQEDENNGADGAGAEGACCADGSVCSAAALCASDAAGTRGHCYDDIAESPNLFGIATGPGTRCDMYAGSQCANFTASVYAPAVVEIQMVNAADESNAISIAKAPADIELEARIGNWDSNGNGTLLKAWEVDIDSAGYTAGIQGFITPTTVACASDADCVAAFGGVCSITGGTCSVNGDCPLSPIENCGGSSCGFPIAGPNAGTQCNPGWIYGGRGDYVYLTQGGTDLKGVDLSLIDYRYASAVAAGDGVPSTDFNPFPANGVYAGTLRLTASADCKGTFTVGLFPPPKSVLVDQNNEFIPLIGFVPATVTCEIARCCIDLTGAGGCWDNVTANQCATGPGTTFFDGGNPSATCDDDCIECLDDSGCDDGDACTVDSCDTSTFLCQHDPLDCADGLTCTVDQCDPASGCFYTPLDCDDGDGCTTDTCAEPNGCVATPVDPDDGDPCTADSCNPADGVITNLDVTTVACTDVADCPAEATGCSAGGFCECVLCPDIVAVADAVCAEAGSKVNVDVVKTPSPNVTAVAFNLSWDSSCMSLNSITPSADWPYVIAENIGAGSLYAAYGVDPFGGGQGTGIEAVVASVSFTKIGDCNACDVCVVDGANPTETLVSFFDQNAQGCHPAVGCSDAVADMDTVAVNCPGDQSSNADCDFPTAVVNWDAPTCDSECGACDLVCTGTGPNGEDLSGLAMGGGEHPIGVSTYSCTGTGTGECSDVATCGWTVTVNDAQTLDVTVQLSPILAGDLQRCIKFELYSDCVQAPVVVEEDLFFGGAWDHIGKFTDDIKIPVGQFACITARDQHHSLRACAYPDCADGVYTAVFKGDPFFGGNWLVQGNLDGWKKDNPIASHDVIDILDFGAFVANYLNLEDPNTPCGHTGHHADINGDGIVDDLDFAFISMNFLASSKDCCCGAATAAVVEPITAITVKELRQSGNADLAAADLNRDGIVDTDDVTAFLQGDRPAGNKPNVRVRTGSGLRR